MKSAKGIVPGDMLGGQHIQIYESPFLVKPHRLCSISPAMNCDHTWETISTRKPFGTQCTKLFLGLVPWAPSVQHAPKLQTSRKLNEVIMVRPSAMGVQSLLEEEETRGCTCAEERPCEGTVRR